VSIVAETWATVQSEGRTDPGWHVRQVYPAAHCDLLAGIHQPGGVPGLLLEAPLDHVPPSLALPRATGFGVETTVIAGGLPGRVRFALTLTDRSYSEIFTVLCEDVAAATADAPSSREALRSCIGRLHAWQAFMARHGTTGLSESAVVGLIGELLVLREKVVPAAGVRSALDMWAGPLGEPNDFSLPGGFVEVKTTSRQAPELLEIANAAQLDDTRGTILLVHVGLRPDPTGVSLPQLVALIRATVVEHAPDRVMQFNRLLMAIGYLDAQADLYTTKYTQEWTEIYLVQGEFPRIRASEVRRGIRNCRYSLELQACVPYLADGNALSAMIGDLNVG
jgi:hypothetical protein